MDTYYETPGYRIGNHEWRIVVADCTSGADRATFYQWRRLGHAVWRDYRTWPTFNGNDGAYSGLPKTTGKVYRYHRRGIEAALAGKEA